MRIIAGVARGRVLSSVAGATRPTSDRAREGVFSSLLSEFGDFFDLNFLDLFAGSGAMGLEALSRGATIVHAVEKDERACKSITTNAELVLKNETAGIFHLYSMPVHKFLEGTPPTTYDIVYVDPPYDVSDAELHKDLVNLRVDGFLNEGSIVAVERADKSGALEWPKGYQPLRSRKYGQALIYYGKLAENG
ncbi:MAG: 16S rRNA (guanine(966)-N(2))-methyltransferase RsmD [Candidatus Nanopelagicaceae bacterium]|nr:16S rRNA (guanine(966)-N(2))-methyltransferase RsmD [Candidatus Nanopelagicaceae bacterium]